MFTPTLMDRQSYDSTVKGQMGEKGQESVVQIKQFGKDAGEQVTYNQVLDHYREEAFSVLGQTDIPEDLKDVVRTYFIELDQE